MEIMIIAGVLGILAVIISYNSLVKSRQRVRNAESQIDVQIQKRFDLVENMRDMVKEYAKHESDVFDNVTTLRTQSKNLHNLDEKIALKNEADKSLKNMLLIAESYPDLKASQNYLALQESLSDAEQQTAFARQVYNDSVTMYNAKIEMFPLNLFAKLFNFKPTNLFEASIQNERN